MTAAAYDILLILPLMLAGYSVAYDLIPMPEMAPGNIRYIVPLLVCAIFAAFKHMKNRGRIVMSGVLLAAALAYFLSLPAGERIEGLLSEIHIFKLILVCIGCYIAGEILNRLPKIRSGAAFAAVAALFVALINGYSAGKMCVCMVFMYLLLNLADLMQSGSKKEGDTQREKHLVFVAPFICGIFIIISLIPVSEKPYEWTVARRIGTMVKDAITELTAGMFKNGESEEVFIGFSGRGDFSGKLKSRNTVALELHTTAGYDDNLYMAGTSFLEFTGKCWTEEGDEENDRRFDAIETMCAVLKADEDGKLNDAVMKVCINVNYRDIKNPKIFLPTKSYVLAEGGEGSAYSYRSMYYRLNRRYEKYDEVMNGEEEITPKIWQAAREYLGLERDESLSYEDYLEYRKETAERYLVDTPVSERMRSWLDTELEGVESDHEKCIKLAALLRGGIYTNEPGELPEGIDDAAGYLDYFIFEKKAGYCSHYATAFVLMARSCGIPARYVQGFRTKVGRKSDTEVRSEAAHAWAEVYLEGRGWTVFEATPGYEVKSGWKVAGDTGQDTAAEENAAEGNAMQQNGGTDQQEDAGGEKKTAVPPGRILIPVLAGVLLALMLWLLDSLYKRRRYKALSERDKCLYLCRQYLAMYKRLGYERMESETLGEFRQRASETASEEYLGFLDTYERLLYAGTDAGEEDRESLEEFGKELRAYIRKRKKEMKEEALYEEDA